MPIWRSPTHFSLETVGIGNMNGKQLKSVAGFSRKNLTRQKFVLAAAVVLTCFCLTNRLFALDPEKSIYQFNCHNWTREDGLPSGKINSIAQTKDGFIW